MPNVGYVYDPLFLEHEKPGHPERPDRLRAIMSHLQESGLLDAASPSPAHGRGARGEGSLTPINPRDANDDDLVLVHEPDLIERIHATAGVQKTWIDADTYAGPRSRDAALRAAGGVLAATDAVIDDALDSAFCLIRPPGHHATPDQAMGFCLFNNVAIAAAHALERRGLQRIAIIDFDVHHGNGTQDIFYSDPRVLYFSTHEFPFYPGTGDWREVGAGNIVNVPLPRGCGDEEYRRCYREICAPIVRRFNPELIFVSAGFDAHFADPLAQMLVSTPGYFEISLLIRELAEEVCNGRVIYALEGGYELTALQWSVRACIDTLLGNDFAEDPLGLGPRLEGPDIDQPLAEVKRAHKL